MSRFVQLTDFNEIFDMWEAGALVAQEGATYVPCTFHIRDAIARVGYEQKRKEVLDTWRSGSIYSDTYGVLVDD